MNRRTARKRRNGKPSRKVETSISNVSCTGACSSNNDTTATDESHHPQTTSTDSMMRKTRRASFLFLALAGVAAVLLLLLLRRPLYDSSSDTNPMSEIDHSISRFLDWFLESGGRLSANVTVASFLEYGHGLSLLGTNDNDDDDDDDYDDDDNRAMEKGEELLFVPAHILFHSEKTLSRLRQYQSQSDVDLVVQNVRKHFRSPLERQDVILALELMVECSLGSASAYYPYISLLPLRVDRLDTFATPELEWLQDPFLTQLAQHSKEQLQLSWNNGLSLVGSKWANTKAAVTAQHVDVDDTCLSYLAFHRFVAIVSSHAMILNHTKKYLVPMADRINHAPCLDAATSASSPEPVAPLSPSLFGKYHLYNAKDGGSITVLADRPLNSGQQIFEEYSKLDNSLFLVAHGFVPHDNPYHCAVLPAKYLPVIDETNIDILKEVFDALGMALPQFPLESICVTRDRSIQAQSGDERVSILAYLSIAHLQVNASQRHKCIEAVRVTRELQTSTVKAECVQYAEHEQKIKRMIQKSVERVMTAAQTSLRDDILLLNEYTAKGSFSSGIFPGMDHTKAALALRFRISDKEVLQAIMGKV